MKIVATLDCQFQVQENKSVHLLCLNFSNFSLHSWLVTTLMVPSISWADFGPRNFTAPQPATVTEAASNCKEHRHRHHHYLIIIITLTLSSRSLGDMEGRHAGVTASVKGTGSWMEVMRMSADVTRCHAMPGA